MAQMTTVRGNAGSSIKPGDVESVSIRRADNGFTVEIQTKQKPLKRANEVRDWDAGRELEVFNKLEDLLARVREAFGGKAEKPEPGEEDDELG
jgi:hypothetical protein